MVKLIRYTMIVIGALLLLIPSSASAIAKSKYFDVGFTDLRFTYPASGESAQTMDKLVQMNANTARLNLYWDSVYKSNPLGGSQEPSQPRNPNDPAYSFEHIDQVVLDAAQRGIGVHFTILSAPHWAEGKGRPAHVRAGAYRPNPAKANAFAEALARRYSGKFTPKTGAYAGVRLPAVRRYEIWNEPNLPHYIYPQTESAKIYRNLVNAFYSGLKGVSKKNIVIAGATSPKGDQTLPKSASKSTRPLAFLRRAFCVQGCKEKIHFDRLSHHPINIWGGPMHPGPTGKQASPDNVVLTNATALYKLLRKGEHKRTIVGAKKHPWLATELWWESNPPEEEYGVSPAVQSQWMQLAMYQVWRAGGSGAYFLQVQDTFSLIPPVLQGRFDVYSSGVLYSNGAAKPSYQAMKFPFAVLSADGGKHTAVWGRSPYTGKLIIERYSNGRWSALRAVNIGKGKVFYHKLQLPYKAGTQLRVRVGTAASSTWLIGQK